MSQDRHRLRVRIGFLALWISILLWLPIEDTSPLNPRILAFLACVLITLRAYLRSGRRALVVFALLGLAAGLLVNPIAAGLMLFKSGLHGHGSPDFSASALAGVLADTPIFGLGGLLIGAGLYYLYRN